MKKIILSVLLLIIPFPTFCEEVTILTTQNSPPNSFYIDGKLTGFAVEYMKAIQKAVGHTGNIKAQPRKRILTRALRKPNILLFSISRNENWENKFHWIANLTTERTKLWAKKENDSWIVMSKNGTSAKTVNQWKNAAAKLKEDGTLKKIAEKWVKYIKNTIGAETNVLYLWED